MNKHTIKEGCHPDCPDWQGYTVPKPASENQPMRKLSTDRIKEIRSVVFGELNPKVPTYAEVIQLCDEIIMIREMPASDEEVERRISDLKTAVRREWNEAAALMVEEAVRLGIRLSAELKAQNVSQKSDKCNTSDERVSACDKSGDEGLEAAANSEVLGAQYALPELDIETLNSINNWGTNRFKSGHAHGKAYQAPISEAKAWRAAIICVAKHGFRGCGLILEHEAERLGIKL